MQESEVHSHKINISVDQKQNINPKTQATGLMGPQWRYAGDWLW